MKHAQEIDSTCWEKIYYFLLECGKTNTPNEFAVSVINHIGEFCRFDAASVYLLDGCGKLCGQYLRNTEDRWSNIYLAYYINTDDKRYSLFRKSAISNPDGKLMLNTYDWDHVESSEFVPHFVKARGLKYSCGFGLYDTNHNLRMLISLDRTQGEAYTKEELQLLRLIIPQLNNLYKNYFYQGYASKAVKLATKETALTARESQIAELLCQSMSPSDISETLHIAQSTTYKHIANIYKKMNVSSQRELLARLLNQPD